MVSLPKIEIYLKKMLFRSTLNTDFLIGDVSIVLRGWRAKKRNQITLESNEQIEYLKLKKTGILRLVEILSDEFNSNIEINAIAPGAIYTNMTKQVLSNSELAGKKEWESANKLSKDNDGKIEKVIELIEFLISTNGISGKIISAQWDDLNAIKNNIQDIQNTDVYTLRRIVPEDRNKK